MYRRGAVEKMVTKPKMRENIPIPLMSPIPGGFPDDTNCSGDFNMETASLENSQKLPSSQKDLDDERIQPGASRDFLDRGLTDVSSILSRSEKRRDITLQEAMDILRSSETTIDESFSIELQEQPLSQPPANIRHRERLEWLQERRGHDGVWVQCDYPNCNKWRYLKNVNDPSELPEKWYCEMNPDPKYNTCVSPEKGPTIQEEVQMIHNLYTAGSVVWAKIAHYPWWPAMVDDDPDCETYYWLNGISDAPTYYNVVFFDSSPVSRKWVSVKFLKSFRLNPDLNGSQRISKNFRERIAVAKTQADDALALNIPERLKKWSFLSRYKKDIVTPPESYDEVSDYVQQPGTAFDYEKFRRIFLKKRTKKSKSDVVYISESNTDNESNADAGSNVDKKNRAKKEKKSKKRTKNARSKKVTRRDKKVMNSEKIFTEINECITQISNLSQTLTRSQSSNNSDRDETQTKNKNVQSKRSTRSQSRRENQNTNQSKRDNRNRSKKRNKNIDQSGKQNTIQEKSSTRSGKQYKTPQLEKKSKKNKISSDDSLNLRSKRSHSTDTEENVQKRPYKRDAFIAIKRSIATSNSESIDVGRRNKKISTEVKSADREKNYDDSIRIKLNEVKQKLMNVMYEVSRNESDDSDKLRNGTEPDSDEPILDYVRHLNNFRGKRRDSMVLDSDSDVSMLGDGKRVENLVDAVQRRVRKDSHILIEDSECEEMRREEFGANCSQELETDCAEFRQTDFGEESKKKSHSESRMESGPESKMKSRSESKKKSCSESAVEFGTKIDLIKFDSGSEMKSDQDRAPKMKNGPESGGKSDQKSGPESHRELRDGNKKKLTESDGKSKSEKKWEGEKNKKSSDDKSRKKNSISDNCDERRCKKSSESVKNDEKNYKENRNSEKCEKDQNESEMNEKSNRNKKLNGADDRQNCRSETSHHQNPGDKKSRRRSIQEDDDETSGKFTDRHRSTSVHNGDDDSGKFRAHRRSNSETAARSDKNDLNSVYKNITSSSGLSKASSSQFSSRTRSVGLRRPKPKTAIDEVQSRDENIKKSRDEKHPKDIHDDTEISNSLETQIGNNFEEDSEISNSLETETGNSCVLDGDVNKKRFVNQRSRLPSDICSESSSHLPNSSISLKIVNTNEPSTSKDISLKTLNEEYDRFIQEINSETMSESSSCTIVEGNERLKTILSSQEDLDISIRSIISGLSKMEDYPCELPNLKDDIIDDIQIVPGDDDNVEEIRKFISQNSIENYIE